MGDFTVSGWVSELTGHRTRSKDRPEEASQVPRGHLVDLGGCPSMGTEHMEARTGRALLPIASRGHTSWGHTFSQEIGRLFRGAHVVCAHSLSDSHPTLLPSMCDTCLVGGYHRRPSSSWEHAVPEAGDWPQLLTPNLEHSGDTGFLTGLLI